MRTSIAIVGGGPAGCAAALTLRRYLPNLTVALVTSPPTKAVDAPTVGETLSPGVLPLLDYLGLRERFVNLGHLPSSGTMSAWGSGHLIERDYLFTGRGHGWHLERSGFDAWLLSSAQEAGAHCIRERAIGHTRSNRLWQIELAGGGELAAQAIVEATGRSSGFLRAQGSAIRKDDRLVAEARWFRHDGHHDGHKAACDAALVESIPDGWWYSASLPGGHGVAMFMTDSDLLKQISWHVRLGAAPATSARLESWQPTGQGVVRAANSQRSQTVVGPGWVAAGDTAAAFDPISALGIGFALRSGMEAARVAVASLESEDGVAAGYAASMVRIYGDYRARLGSLYELEKRWPRNTFWARRHGQC